MPRMHERMAELERRLSHVESANPSLIDRAARFVACEMIEGDYIEFGVYRGQSFTAAYHAFRKAFAQRIGQLSGNSPEQQQRRRKLWDQMRFVALDSFEGLPALAGRDQRTHDFACGQYAATSAEFEQTLLAARVEMHRVHIVPGWFDATANDHTWSTLGITKAAVVWIDSDLYASAKTALDSIVSLLQDGTVLIFDDWFAYRANPDLGEQAAFAEWLHRLPGFRAIPYMQEGTWRKAFIMSACPVPRAGLTRP